MEIILAVVFLVLAGVFFIVAKGLEKMGKNFQKGMKYGKAEVVGYDRDTGSNWRSLVVRLYDVDSNLYYNCKSKKISIADYPKGTVVDVIYAPKYVMGSLWYDVRLNEEGKLPEDDSILARRFGCIAKVLLGSALFLLCLFFIL